LRPFSGRTPSAPSRWELAAETIAVRIRWFGLLVGYFLVNFAGHAADQARQQRGTGPRRRVLEHVAVAADAASASHPHRHGVGGVGPDGRNAQEHQGGKRDERAAAGGRVDGGGDRGCARRQDESGWIHG